MAFRRYGTFTGGIDLPDEKHHTLDSSIAPCPAPRRLMVPLAPWGGAAARPVVQVGQDVTASELLAAGDSDAVPIFAPLSGRVDAVSRVFVAGDDGFAPSPALVLSHLSPPQPIHAQAPVFDWRAADGPTLLARIAEGGLTLFRRRGRRLADWIDRARQKRCDILLANVLENQPLVTADHRLLAEQGPNVVRGLAILAQAMGIEDVMLAVDNRRTDSYRELIGPSRIYNMTCYALTYKYPIGADAILIKTLTNREIPPGGSGMDVGVAVIDAATCFALYQWVACGLPPTSRVVTVSGKHAAAPGNYWVPMGMDCAELAGPPRGAGKTGATVFLGGPMTGLKCLSDSVVSPPCNAVLLGANPLPPEPGPCIRCGWCTDHCPARLNVAALNDAFELGLIEQAARGVAPACVECGVCSYVCPARLPLSQRVRRLKRAVMDLNRTMPLFHSFPPGGKRP